MDIGREREGERLRVRERDGELEIGWERKRERQTWRLAERYKDREKR